MKDYNYSLPGMCFVTINIHGNAPILGRIIHGEMQLNEAGAIAYNFWIDLPNHIHGLKLDTFIIMPNHLHGILFLTDESANRKSLSEIIHGFKTWSAKRINESQNTKGTQIWQRSFYDHIIRNEQALDKIREYIVNNLLKWEINKGFHSYDELFK